MKRFLVYIFLVFGCYFSFAQKEVENTAFNTMLKGLLSHSVEEVIPSDLKGRSDILFLDAREKKEFEISHIKGAIWVGFDDFKLNRIENIPENQEIVVYCSVGYRSEKIAEKLKKTGYKEVYNLYGGIFEWVHQGNKIYNRTSATERVHTFDKEWSQWLFKGVKVY